MSIYQLTDNRGNTYAISSGHWLNSTGPDQYRGALDALPHLNGDELFRAEQAVFHFHNTELFQRLRHRLGNGWEFHPHPLPSATALPLQLQGRWALILDAIYHGELSFSKINSTKQKPAEKPEADNRGVLRSKIRIALAGIVAAEKAEAAHHTQNLRRETTVNRGMIYTGAFLTGLWDAGTDLTQWLKDVNDCLNPVQRSLRGIQASYRALQKTRSNNTSFLEACRDELVTAEKRELVQVLGFDPGSITREQFDRALEIAGIIWEDVALQADLRRFVKDYAAAQHALEITELSGGAAFEVLFTIVLAAVTAGAGLALGSSNLTRHMVKFRQVGKFLESFAENTKSLRSMSKKFSHLEHKKAQVTLDELPKLDVPPPINDFGISRPASVKKSKDSSDIKVQDLEIKETILQARERQKRMLEDNIGFNVSPTEWDEYPTIGRNGTFISDMQGITDVLGKLPEKSPAVISKKKATELEEAFGLTPGTLNDGFKVRKIENVIDRMSRSPLEGNEYFLGPGNHLPGGAPEIVIDSIPTTDGNGVSTLLEVYVR
ncbi:hypothetical protein [Microbulbifer pacificus]|uniref:Uncharacterized protein n=1 Tax=Microbulbifer pacificus TaxID=407164 RepID=A0AAU0MV36_9GAMM|nr:hypothetical protein [Microbulbifer pacificus]WOX04034.1 hypothetical protein R5R33_09795 [Microbulbifer pacificus]